MWWNAGTMNPFFTLSRLSGIGSLSRDRTGTQSPRAVWHFPV